MGEEKQNKTPPRTPSEVAGGEQCWSRVWFMRSCLGVRCSAFGPIASNLNHLLKKWRRRCWKARHSAPSLEKQCLPANCGATLHFGQTRRVELCSSSGFFFNGHPKAGREHSIFTSQGIPPGGICEIKNERVKRQASLCWETLSQGFPPRSAGPLELFSETQGSLVSGCFYQKLLRLMLMLLPHFGSLPVSREACGVSKPIGSPATSGCLWRL